MPPRRDFPRCPRPRRRLRRLLLGPRPPRSPGSGAGRRPSRSGFSSGPTRVLDHRGGRRLGAVRHRRRRNRRARAGGALSGRMRHAGDDRPPRVACAPRRVRGLHGARGRCPGRGHPSPGGPGHGAGQSTGRAGAPGRGDSSSLLRQRSRRRRVHLVPGAYGARGSALLLQPVDLSPLRSPVPRTWVRPLRDAIVDPEKQLEFAGNVGNCDVIDMDAGHMCMISQPAELASMLNQIALIRGSARGRPRGDRRFRPSPSAPREGFRR